MPSYRLSKAAVNDIRQILDYSYNNFGEKVAEDYYLSLQKCLLMLSENPLIGQDSSELRAGYFRHPHKSHRIFYKLTVTGIFVVRVLHKSVDVKRYL